MANIGLFGGTFDPVHTGHLILAERVRESAALDAVWFLPSYQPPHKDGVITRFDHRAEMVTLAITSQPLFRLETIERELPPPSYTLHTLDALMERHLEHTFHLIVGADCLPDIPQWYEPKKILERVPLVAVPRPGTELWRAEQLAAAVGIASVRLTFVESPLIDIASRDLRQRVKHGKTIRYEVPRAVEEYIREKRLYQ